MLEKAENLGDACVCDSHTRRFEKFDVRKGLCDLRLVQSHTAQMADSTLLLLVQNLPHASLEFLYSKNAAIEKSHGLFIRWPKLPQHDLVLRALERDGHSEL